MWQVLVSVVLDETGASKGFGFIRFGNETEQQTALTTMQGISGLGDKPIKVSQSYNPTGKNGRVFLVPYEKWLIHCTLQYTCTLDKSIFTGFQKHTVLYNLSPCTYILNTSHLPAMGRGDFDHNRRTGKNWRMKAKTRIKLGKRCKIVHNFSRCQKHILFLNFQSLQSWFSIINVYWVYCLMYCNCLTCVYKGEKLLLHTFWMTYILLALIQYDFIALSKFKNLVQTIRLN